MNKENSITENIYIRMMEDIKMLMELVLKKGKHVQLSIYQVYLKSKVITFKQGILCSQL